MKITIIAAGSRGDIQPYLALGKGLHDAGHAVKLTTHANFKAWIEGYGIEFADLTGNPKEMIEGGIAQEWVNSGANPFKFANEFRRLMAPIMKQAMQDTWEASKGADLILPSALSYYAGYVCAREMSIPWMQTFLQPIHPAREFPSPILPGYRGYGGAGNYVSHLVGGLLFWNIMRPGYNDVLKGMGIKGFPPQGVFYEVENAGIPALYGFSEALIPRPKNWAPHLHMTGYWFLDEGHDWTPPADLVDFLQAGPPPVYVGFGSMPNEDPEATARLVIEALRKAGQRGLILTGWGGLTGQSGYDDIHFIEGAPHDWLFPRVAAVVHHAGAGTTAAGLRAGKPTITVPFFADQPWWSTRVYQRGVGPKPIPRKELTADRLAQAIHDALNGSGIRECAAKVGEMIRAEDGVARGVALVEQYMVRV